MHNADPIALAGMAEFQDLKIRWKNCRPLIGFCFSLYDSLSQ